MRLTSVTLCLSVLLQGCSWTYINSVPDAAPASLQERNKRVAQCTENRASSAVTGDIVVSAIQVPLLVGGSYLIAQHQGDSPMLALFGTGIWIASGTTLLLHGLSWYFGAKHKKRCEAFLNGIPQPQAPVPPLH